MHKAASWTKQDELGQEIQDWKDGGRVGHVEDDDRGINIPSGASRSAEGDSKVPWPARVAPLGAVEAAERAAAAAGAAGWAAEVAGAGTAGTAGTAVWQAGHLAVTLHTAVEYSQARTCGGNRHV